MSTERTSFQNLTATLIFAAMIAALTLRPSARAYGADENASLLAGTVKSDSGEKMAGQRFRLKRKERPLPQAFSPISRVITISHRCRRRSMRSGPKRIRSPQLALTSI